MGDKSKGPTASLGGADVSTGQKTRLLYIDNMRVALIVLVIVGHMAMTYGAPIGDWYYHEEGSIGPVLAITFVLLLGIGSSFLLGLFLMIAGYFTPRPVDRKGPGAFTLDRLKRLGIPLVLYALVINPLVTHWAALAGGYEGSLWTYIPTHLDDLTNAAVGPLWFVEGLLVFSLVYAALRAVTWRVGLVSERSRVVLPVPGDLSIAIAGLGLGLVTFVVRIWAPVGWWWEPLHQELAHYPQYVVLFALGIIAYRHDWFARFPAGQSRLWGWVALGLVPVLPVLAVAAGALTGEMDTSAAGGFTWLSLVYSLWEGFMGVATVITVLVWFRERVNRQGRLVRAMSGASYGVYVLHPLIIVPLALGMRWLHMDLSLKFLLVGPLAVVLCFLAGYLVRRLPLVRTVL